MQTYFRITLKSAPLLAAGAPPLDYCEVSGAIVTRRVQRLANSQAFRRSLEGADEFRRKMGLRETPPDLAQNNELLTTEEITAEQFESAYAGAEPAPAGWD